MKKIAFMGSDPIALPLLNFLWSQKSTDYQLVGVISQPDRPSGRGHKVTPNAISAWALEKGLPLFRPEKPSEIELEWLKETPIDLVLVMAYGHIIKQNFLDTPPLGMLNFHGSLLPQYRGASPVEAAIASGDTETGISLMQMVAKMDAGGVMNQEKVEITDEDTSESLRLKLGECCVPLIERNLPIILKGEHKFVPQDESKVTYTRKISKEDGWLNFNSPAKTLDYRIRALTPWPGGSFKTGDIVIKIGSCSSLEVNQKFCPGTVIGVDENGDNGLLVSTGKGTLCLKSLQRPGGRMLPIQEFLRGFPIEKGTVLESGPMNPLVNTTPFPWKI